MNAWAGVCLIWGLTTFSVLILGILYFCDRLSTRRAAQQEMLLQRIQAPQTAVDQHVIKEAQAQARMTPHFDNDEEFHELMEASTIGFDPLAAE